MLLDSSISITVSEASVQMVIENKKRKRAVTALTFDEGSVVVCRPGIPNENGYMGIHLTDGPARFDVPLFQYSMVGAQLRFVEQLYADQV